MRSVDTSCGYKHQTISTVRNECDWAFFIRIFLFFFLFTFKYLLSAYLPNIENTQKYFFFALLLFEFICWGSWCDAKCFRIIYNRIVIAWNFRYHSKILPVFWLPKSPSICARVIWKIIQSRESDSHKQKMLWRWSFSFEVVQFCINGLRTTHWVLQCAYKMVLMY